MKRILFICLLAAASTGCKKSLQYESSANNISAAPSTIPPPIPAPPYKWVDLGVPVLTSDPRNEAEMSNVIYNLNGDHYLGTGYQFRKVYKFNTSSKSWDRMASMSFEGVYARERAFVFGSKIYFGFDYDNPRYFASYDPFTGVTTQLADYPGTPVDDPIYFVFGSKAYLVSGLRRTGDLDIVNQYWEYDFLTNQWKNKGLSPIGLRAQGSAYTINGKVYIGLGFTWVSTNPHTKKFYNDWTEIDPNTPGVRIPKATFPGEPRRSAKGFMIGSTLHLGFGKILDAYRYDLYKYNASLNTWTQVAPWPSEIEGIYGAAWTDGQLSMFGSGSAGYLVKGGLNEFWTFSNALP